MPLFLFWRRRFLFLFFGRRRLLRFRLRLLLLFSFSLLFFSRLRLLFFLFFMFFFFLGSFLTLAANEGNFVADVYLSPFFDINFCERSLFGRLPFHGRLIG